MVSLRRRGRSSVGATFDQQGPDDAGHLRQSGGERLGRPDFQPFAAVAGKGSVDQRRTYRPAIFRINVSRQ